MKILRQSTSQLLRFGPFVDSTDGVTPETALTIAQADMQLSKDGAAFAQKNASGPATHDIDGWYSTTLNTTDTATLGELIFQVNVSGALPSFIHYTVVHASSYDAFVTNGLNDFDPTSDTVATVTSVTNQVTADVTSVSGDTTAANNLELDYDGTGYAKANSTIGTCTTNTDMRGTDSALLAASAPANFSLLGISGGGAITTVTTVTTCTTNTDMRGTDSALLAASAPSNFSDLSIAASTGLVDVTQAAADKSWLTATRELTSGSNIVLAKGVGVTGFNDLSAAQVNAEVVDVLFVDAVAEPTSAVAANGSLTAKLSWMCALSRNKLTQTSSTQTLRNDADSSDIASAAVTDDTVTFTRNEFT